jgi:hypothetical protein
VESELEASEAAFEAARVATGRQAAEARARHAAAEAEALQAEEEAGRLAALDHGADGRRD